MVLENGVPKSGTIRSKAVTLGTDKFDRTTKGTLYYRAWNSPDAPLRRTETIDLTEKWWGTVTAGTDESAIAFNGGVPTTDSAQTAGSTMTAQTLTTVRDKVT